mgnify:CR=1 FL=1
MLIGKVVGTIVATQKEPTLDGSKFLVVRSVDLESLASTGGKPMGAPIVALDAVGAGVGEIVLVASGSSARQTEQSKERPVDAVVMAIVDQVAVGGLETYNK